MRDRPTAWTGAAAGMLVAAALSTTWLAPGADRQGPGGVTVAGHGSPRAIAAARAIRRPDPTTPQWTVYHGNPAGSGVARTRATLSTLRRAWVSEPLGGQVYGEPLVATGMVIVATEHDTVDALRERTGRVAWTTTLGRPVPAGDLPCGDIAPTVGVTGTPVVDRSRREVFVVADELAGGRPAHHLVGMSLSTGKVLSDEVVDPPGADPAALLQRTGLALDRGDVVFGLGGNYGDCGTYHGWVVSVPEGGGTAGIRRYEADAAPGSRRGAVWMGGAAPEVAPDGDVWVAVGNGSVVRPGPYDGSDAIVDLTPALVRRQYFAPAAWYSDNAADLDLGSTPPAFVSGGLVVQVGKSGTAYLLVRSRLGGIGGQRAEAAVCDGGPADGGAAVSRRLVILPCRAGLEAVRVGAGSLSAAWSANGPDGPPIVAGGTVWAIGGDTLYGLRRESGDLVTRVVIGSNANHFPSPSYGDGLLLVTGGSNGDEVLAFSPSPRRRAP